MKLPSPPAPNDVRLRKHLHDTLPPSVLPTGYRLRPFTADQAKPLHTLLREVFDDGSDGPFKAWWASISADTDFDPDLCFLVYGPDDELAAAALCWRSAFIKDLAVRAAHRRRGLGEALALHAFNAFRQRGAGHVDLKTNTILNADALRLYQRLGMVPVDWEG